MQWSVTVPDGQKLTIDKEFWTGKIELRRGNAIFGKMGMVRQQTFPITMKDGTEHSLTVKHCWLDPVPLVLLGGKDLLSALRFSKLQTAFICLPAVLMLKLGAIPALIAVGCIYFNFFIARQGNLAMPLRWAVISIVPVIGLVAILYINDLVWGPQAGLKHKGKHHQQAATPIKPYDPTEDDREARLWAHPRGNTEEAARQERWVREGR